MCPVRLSQNWKRSSRQVKKQQYPALFGSFGGVQIVMPVNPSSSCRVALEIGVDSSDKLDSHGRCPYNLNKISRGNLSSGRVDLASPAQKAFKIRAYKPVLSLWKYLISWFYNFTCTGLDLIGYIYLPRKCSEPDPPHSSIQHNTTQCIRKIALLPDQEILTVQYSTY